MNLKDFVTLVATNKSLDCEIILKGTVDETQLLEDLCKVSEKKDRLDEAWSIILDAIAEKFYPEDMTDFFTPQTLNFLIENKIALNDLGHLQLKDEWLLKIYEKDNNCREALQTVKLRKNH